MNDVFSYQKEIEFEGEVHNGVLVVQTFFDCDYPTGARDHQRPDDLPDAPVPACRRPTNCPSCTTTSSLPEQTREALDGYVRELENWMAGILTWHEGCRRYREVFLSHGPGSPRWSGGPVGLGTSAARVLNSGLP